MKPKTAEGYSSSVTVDCERLLVTLLAGLGPWKRSFYLIGGLTPRYLVAAAPPAIPNHAGTTDVDMVIDLEVLIETEAYATLEQNLVKLGFERDRNAEGKPVNWRWIKKISEHKTLAVELLSDLAAVEGGKARRLPTDKNVSVLNIPHSSMAVDCYVEREIRAERLDDGGTSVEVIRHADIAAFICLKALAFEDRREAKDSYDLVYSLTHCPGGYAAAAELMKRHRQQGKHSKPIELTIDILRRRFATEGGTEGHTKDGPTAYANFHASADQDDRDRRIRLQRDANGVVELFLREMEKS